MKSLLTVVIFWNTFAMASEGTRAIYGGVDDRKDLQEITDTRLLDIIQSTAVQVDSKRISSVEGSNNLISKLTGKRIKNYWYLCDYEKFRDQMMLGSCSATLIGPDLVITAGHCVSDTDSCENSRWVFDYNSNLPIFDNDDEKNTSFAVMSSSKIYSCKKIVKASFENFDFEASDYAIIQLDRSVTDRQPVKLNLAERVKIDDKITVIGYPTGLPVKITEGKVFYEEKNFFFTDNDLFKGNSGSPFLNSKGEIVGVLSTGGGDYTHDAESGWGMSSCYKTVKEPEFNPEKRLDQYRYPRATRLESVADIINGLNLF